MTRLRAQGYTFAEIGRRLGVTQKYSVITE
jgi:hypothetical protein